MPGRIFDARAAAATYESTDWSVDASELRTEATPGSQLDCGVAFRSLTAASRVLDVEASRGAASPSGVRLTVRGEIRKVAGSSSSAIVSSSGIPSVPIRSAALVAPRAMSNGSPTYGMAAAAHQAGPVVRACARCASAGMPSAVWRAPARSPCATCASTCCSRSRISSASDRTISPVTTIHAIHMTTSAAAEYNKPRLIAPEAHQYRSRVSQRVRTDCATAQDPTGASCDPRADGRT